MINDTMIWLIILVVAFSIDFTVLIVYIMLDDYFNRKKLIFMPQKFQIQYNEFKTKSLKELRK